MRSEGKDTYTLKTNLALIQIIITLDFFQALQLFLSNVSLDDWENGNQMTQHNKECACDSSIVLFFKDRRMGQSME